MGPICKHNQSGFCKLGEKKCPMIHNNETCPRASCENASCEKRHPKICKYFALNNTCKFNKKCTYLHIENKTNVKLEIIEKEIVAMKDDIKKLTNIVKDMTVKLQEVIDSRNSSSEKRFSCDQCSYSSKNSSTLRNHKKKKHEDIQQLDANDTLEKEDAPESESSGDDSYSESDYDEETEDFTCFRELTEDSEIMTILDSTEKCEECNYENADLAELIVHVVKKHNHCECCDTEQWLDQSIWVRKYDKFHQIMREDPLMRLHYREEICPKYRQWKHTNSCLYKQ